jgi:hypothetical protein
MKKQGEIVFLYVFLYTYAKGGQKNELQLLNLTTGHKKAEPNAGSAFRFRKKDYPSLRIQASPIPIAPSCWATAVNC